MLFSTNASSFDTNEKGRFGFFLFSTIDSFLHRKSITIYIYSYTIHSSRLHWSLLSHTYRNIRMWLHSFFGRFFFLSLPLFLVILHSPGCDGRPIRERERGERKREGEEGNREKLDKIAADACVYDGLVSLENLFSLLDYCIKFVLRCHYSILLSFILYKESSMSITRWFFCFRLCILFHRFFPVAFSSLLFYYYYYYSACSIGNDRTIFVAFLLSRLLAEVGDF